MGPLTPNFLCHYMAHNALSFPDPHPNTTKLHYTKPPPTPVQLLGSSSPPPLFGNTRAHRNYMGTHTHPQPHKSTHCSNSGWLSPNPTLSIFIMPPTQWAPAPWIKHLPQLLPHHILIISQTPVIQQIPLGSSLNWDELSHTYHEVICGCEGC